MAIRFFPGRNRHAVLLSKKVSGYSDRRQDDTSRRSLRRANADAQQNDRIRRQEEQQGMAPGDSRAVEK